MRSIEYRLRFLTLGDTILFTTDLKSTIVIFLVVDGKHDRSRICALFTPSDHRISRSAA